MNTHQLPLTEPTPQMPDLPVSQMNQDALDTLSYIFCGNVRFKDFDSLLLYFTVGLPWVKLVSDFWDEVEDLGYNGHEKAPL